MKDRDARAGVGGVWLGGIIPFKFQERKAQEGVWEEETKWGGTGD